MLNQVVDAFNPGANNSVLALAQQVDGSLLVGGMFSTLGGQNCARLGRVLPDGTFDASFSASANGNVWALALQINGQIVVAGEFTSLSDLAQRHKLDFHVRELPLPNAPDSGIEAAARELRAGWKHTVHGASTTALRSARRLQRSRRSET